MHNGKSLTTRKQPNPLLEFSGNQPEKIFKRLTGRDEKQNIYTETIPFAINWHSGHLIRFTL